MEESNRNRLKDIAESIGNIAGRLMVGYKKDEAKSDPNKKNTFLVSLVIFDKLAAKKYEYKDQPVTFETDFTVKSKFAFIKVNQSSFERMLSNLINNSVDAFKGKEGQITIKLSAKNNKVTITVKDNGCGMPEEVKNKILQYIQITHGKEANKDSGHGLGMTQVMDTIRENNGKISIDSVIGKGTEITVFFDQVNIPNWFTDKLKLYEGDIIIILDDDNSIHGAWNLRFERYKSKITVKHFHQGQETIDFILNLDDKQKANVFLLSDYELLKQELTGLQVIDKLKSKLPLLRSLLVTSHYNNEEIQKAAIQQGIKLLPKQFAAEVKINISKKETGTNLRKVDLVLIDDDPMLLDVLYESVIRKGKKVDKYYNPHKFLEKLDQYPKSTRVFFDHDFGIKSFSGFILAELLHNKGYKNLFMLTGMEFDKKEIPNYLKIIPKGTLEDMNELYK